ncbi:MAG: serine/threonine-protein kinase [Polyangiales bacterium]
MTGDPFGLAGSCLDDRFDVGEAVAEGGFGVVYRATHASLGKRVALKVLKPDTEGDPAERMKDFAREARTLARLDHPAVARVVDFGVSTLPSGHRAPWMALDWIEGETLAAWQRAHPGARLSRAECMRWMRPVLEGVAAAHALGVAHRDIKPSNLLLAGGDDAPLRLVDFGVAGAFERGAPAPSGETMTASARAAWSPRYAAPEQIAGTRTGPWTDVHALALVVTELLTGAPAYPADDAMALHLAALSRDRPTPASRGVDVGPWEPVLARALALQPAERHPDARALLDALLAADAARTPSRNPLRAVGAAALAALAAVALWSARADRAPRAVRAPAPAAPGASPGRAGCRDARRRDARRASRGRLVQRCARGARRPAPAPPRAPRRASRPRT